MNNICINILKNQYIDLIHYELVPQGKYSYIKSKYVGNFEKKKI